MVEQKVVDDYKTINDKLLLYDWFVSPYYSGIEFNKIRKLTAKLSSPTGRTEKEAFSKSFVDMLIKGNLNYHFRSIVVFEGYRVTPNLRKFSHLFEAGLFEFYRLNFITCLGVWIPIIEGVIRSFLNVTFDESVNRNDLRKLRAKYSEEQPFLDAVIDTILKYLSETFFKNVHGQSDLGAHNFNRHFFSHSISNEPLYCRDNCLRLLNIFDSFLAIDFIVDSYFKAIFDGSHKRIKEREQYYRRIESALSDRDIFRTELLKDHPFFNEQFYFGQ
jgi:hypothetical protein